MDVSLRLPLNDVMMFKNLLRVCPTSGMEWDKDGMIVDTSLALDE